MGEASQPSRVENQVSSTTVSLVKGLPVRNTAAVEEDKITLLMEDTFAQEFRTFSVPFTAGSIISS